MPKPVNQQSSTTAPVPPPLSGDAFEVSRLLLELMHVTYAGRGAAAADAFADPDRTHARPAPSTHAVRAAIHVYQHGEPTVGELAAGLGISYGWASRVISELETAGMVARQTDDSDRRIVRVRLTPEAVAMVENAYRWRGEAVERALATLDADGRRAVAAFLRRVTEELARSARERGRGAARGGRS